MAVSSGVHLQAIAVENWVLLKTKKQSDLVSLIAQDFNVQTPSELFVVSVLLFQAQLQKGDLLQNV